MSIQGIIVLVVVAAAAFLLLRSLIRTFRGDAGCGCGTKSCSKTGAQDRIGIKTKPMVGESDIGLPKRSPKQSPDPN